MLAGIKNRTPFYKADWGPEEEEAVLRVMRAGRGTMGGEVEALEKEFAEFIGVKHAIAVDSCSNAMFLCLRYTTRLLQKYTNGADITIPSLTFPGVASIVIAAGCDLIVDDEIHVGRAYPLKGSSVWDCAHELKKNPGDDLFCYSFYPTKNISACEGGMIATDDDVAAEQLRLMRLFGRQAASSWDYEMITEGFKMNMTDIQAAIARVQLRRWPEHKKRRDDIVRFYNDKLDTNCLSDHLYFLPVPDRHIFMAYMAEHGIDCSVHFAKPIHKHRAFHGVKTVGSMAKVEAYADNIVSLPLYPSLTDNEVLRICELTQNWRESCPT